MIDYGQVEWDRVKIKMKSRPTAVVQLKIEFLARRGKNEVFVVVNDNKHQWQPTGLGPDVGFVLEPP
jgi:hypothetical protein